MSASEIAMAVGVSRRTFYRSAPQRRLTLRNLRCPDSSRKTKKAAKWVTRILTRWRLLHFCALGSWQSWPGATASMTRKSLSGRAIWRSWPRGRRGATRAWRSAPGWMTLVSLVPVSDGLDTRRGRGLPAVVEPLAKWRMQRPSPPCLGCRALCCASGNERFSSSANSRHASAGTLSVPPTGSFVSTHQHAAGVVADFDAVAASVGAEPRLPPAGAHPCLRLLCRLQNENPAGRAGKRVSADAIKDIGCFPYKLIGFRPSRPPRSSMRSTSGAPSAPARLERPAESGVSACLRGEHRDSDVRALL